MRTFQIILKTISHATLTRPKSHQRMSYCLEQIVNIDRQCLHFAATTALMCHICHHQATQQARLTASHPCQPDDSTAVSLIARVFFQCAGIWVGSGQGNRSIDNPTSDGNSSDPNARIILPHADRKLPAKLVPRVPSKTSFPAPKNGAGGRLALDGHSVSTKQFAIAHKSQALALALEKKRAANLDHKTNKVMSICLQELESMFAQSSPVGVPDPVLPAPAARCSTRDASALFADQV